MFTNAGYIFICKLQFEITFIWLDVKPLLYFSPDHMSVRGTQIKRDNKHKISKIMIYEKEICLLDLPNVPQSDVC